ncbi:MAG TPA: hypothetical protein VIP77_01980 [Jiangellaceae bacterium]
MARLLGALGHAGARNLTWSCTRYLTPYFSSLHPSDDWRDQLTMTWAVEIHTDDDGDPEDAGSHNPGPHGCHAHDSTYVDDDTHWERAREGVWVIAGDPYGPEVDVGPLEDTVGVLSADPSIFAGAVALDLGELDLPDAIPLIDDVRHRCRDLGLRTNWRDPGRSRAEPVGAEV